MGTRIKELRTSKHMTQTSLALAIGSSQGVISKIERGITLPDSEMLCRIASYFNTSVSYVLGETDIIETIPQTLYTISPRTLHYAYKLDMLPKSEKESIFLLTDALYKATEKRKE